MTERHRALSAALKGQGLSVICDDPGRRSLRSAIFNGAVDARPFEAVACDDEMAVRAAVRVAADHGVPVSVVAGGHDLCGRAFAADNLVLDLRRMSRVHVDRATGEATIGGAALTRDLLAALPDDLAVVTGTVMSVGVTGLTLAGGYGRLNSRFGLASDNVKRARIVLADGSVATASERDDPDLFWGLRGGGSGFGVVTSMTLAAHELPKVWNAMILVPLEQAAEGLLRAQHLLDRHSVELSLFMGFVTPPTGGPVVLFLAPLWSGDPTFSETLLRQLSFQGSLVIGQGWVSYKGTFDEESEKAWPKGRHYHIPTQTLRRIDRQAADMLIEGARRITSPYSALAVHDFHGAATRVAANATAFPLREDHFVVEVIAAWDDASGGARHRRWADELSTNLSVMAIPGGYTNLLLPEEGERVRLFYGAAAQKLHELKRRLDPRDMFRSGIGRLDPRSVTDA